MRTFASVDEFSAAVGTHLGDSPWHTVDQERIDTFADATGDHQWIHVDQERAAAGPFGGTIAHGFLTLSMVPVMLSETFTVEGLQAFMNYGTDRIRFMRPVPAGSRIQASASLTSVEETPLGVRAVVSVEVRLDDGGKPACVAELITLLIR
jgi:acyl dehydratase